MKSVVILVLLGFIALAVAKPLWHQLDKYDFDAYVKDFGKSYARGEYLARKRIFDSRLVSIKAHNADTSKTWKEGVNHMSDWYPAELKNLFGLKKSLLYSSKANHTETYPPNAINPSALPKHVDWREKGVISAVKDQGQCGSCWTFGTAETIESHWALKHKQLTDLSEQQILDCTPNPNHCGGTGGCSGGTPELAYAMIINQGGLSTEWMYPYISYFGSNYNCHFDSGVTIPLAKLTGYHVLPSNKLTPVLQTLATTGPLAVNVDASAWAFYETGVFDGCNQTNPDIDHVVQLVGYGTDPTYGDYWLVRNSWSPTWGEDGYIRLRRTATPRCGVDLNPQDGTGCNGGPSQVTVCGTCAILYAVSYPAIVQ